MDRIHAPMNEVAAEVRMRRAFSVVAVALGALLLTGGGARAGKGFVPSLDLRPRVLEGDVRSIARMLTRAEAGEPCRVGLLDVVMVQPDAFLLIEDRRSLAYAFKRKLLDQLRGREDLLVAVGPAEPGQIVHERLGQVTQVAVFRHGRGAVAFRELGLVRAQDHGQVREAGDVSLFSKNLEDMLNQQLNLTLEGIGGGGLAGTSGSNGNGGGAGAGMPVFTLLSGSFHCEPYCSWLHAEEAFNV